MQGQPQALVLWAHQEHAHLVEGEQFLQAGVGGALHLLQVQGRVDDTGDAVQVGDLLERLIQFRGALLNLGFQGFFRFLQCGDGLAHACCGSLQLATGLPQGQHDDAQKRCGGEGFYIGHDLVGGAGRGGDVEGIHFFFPLDMLEHPVQHARWRPVEQRIGHHLSVSTASAARRILPKVWRKLSEWRVRMAVP